MSIPAVGWVTKQVRGISTTERAVLYVLADMANERSGKQQAWPAVRSIADILEVNYSTVQRALKSLEKKGFIGRGDQGLARGLRCDRKPIVWELNCPND